MERGVKRGDIWTVSGGPDYAGKPRPVVIVQDDRFDATDSVTACGFTSVGTETPLARPEIAPTDDNGLRMVSWLMADKVTTVRKDKLRDRIGRLSPDDIRRLDRALIVFLGLAG